MMSKYFTLQEFVRSSTADKLRIDNTPNDAVKKNIEKLAAVMDKLREEADYPLVITSGYRCEKLNKAVGGVKTSAHTLGLAADFVPQGNCKDINDLYFKLIDYLESNDISYDQIIIENNGKSKWIHFGLENLDGLQRKQHFSLSV